MLEGLQYRVLRTLAPPQSRLTEASYAGTSKLRLLLGDATVDSVAGKRVIDYGCGAGNQSLELARAGAIVTGVDIQTDLVEAARQRAREMGLACSFTTHAEGPADVVVSIDAFEHFTDPGGVLRDMARLLAPGGRVEVVFGYTWYHPLGGHLFSLFPWAHLIFSEAALIRWRSTVRDDGAKTIAEVKGGLNRMTIGRFERLVAKSPLRIESMEQRPIRRVRWLHCRWTREFFTSLIRCRLVLR